MLVREPYAERDSTWTGLGFMQVHEDSSLEFDITDVPTSMEYEIVFRYEPKVSLSSRHSFIGLVCPCSIN